MGRHNRSLFNIPPDDAEIRTNRELEQPRAGEDSDSEEENEQQWGGYMPLSQNPNDGEPLYSLNNESDDEEINLDESGAENLSEEDNILVPKPKAASTTLVEEVWSKPTPKELDIEMSEKKIDLVKQVMLNIQIPSEAIPSWARNIPEDEWKDHLFKRLQNSDM